MKIAWVTPELRGRGVTTVCEDAASAVACQSAHDVHLVSIHSNKPVNDVNSSVALHELRLPRQDIKAACTGFHDWVASVRPDVVLFNDTPAIEPYWRYAPACVKTVAVLHDHAHGWVRSAVDFQASLNGIVTCSDFVMKEVRSRLKGYTGVLEVVENGARYPERMSRTVSDGPLRLVFFGAIERTKGAFDLPEILYRCKCRGLNVILTVVGGQSEELGSAFIAKGVADQVVWAGRLPREQCFPLLAASDVLLMLSRLESFGLVTVEAMAMGCVPVAYSGGGTSGILESGECGVLVALCDYDGVVDAVAELCNDRKRLESLSRGAEFKARSRYCVEQMGRRYIEVIEAVAESGRSVERLAYDKFVPRIGSHRLYSRFVPSSIRRKVNAIASAFPRVECFLRRYKGI